MQEAVLIYYISLGESHWKESGLILPFITNSKASLAPYSLTRARRASQLSCHARLCILGGSPCSAKCSMHAGNKVFSCRGASPHIPIGCPPIPQSALDVWANPQNMFVGTWSDLDAWKRGEGSPSAWVDIILHMCTPHNKFHPELEGGALGSFINFDTWIAFPLNVQSSADL